MTSNIDEPSISTNSPINVKIDCEPAELEHFEETKLEDCDLANSPRRSRTVSVDNESELLERLEDFEETKLEDCDLSKSPRRSRNDSLDDESDNRNSPQENLSRKRQRSSSSRSFEEHFEETKLKDCDLANSPRRSRTVSVDNESELLERLEDFDETKLEDCDLSNTPRRSRSVSVDNESDNRNSPQEYLSRKRQRSSSSRSLSPRRKAFRGRDGRRHDDNPKPSRCLGVFGLSVHTRENDLRGIFSKYGEIETIIIVRSFAFVYYEAIEDARSAKKRCNGIEIKGRNIRVDYSMTEKPNDSSKSRSRYDWNRSHGRNNNRRHYDNRRFRSSPRNNRRRS